MNKNILFVLMAIALIFVIGCQASLDAQVDDNNDDQNDDDQDNMANDDSDGRVVATITDAAADMGSVTEVWVEVKNVRAYSQAEGWVTLDSSTKTYNLLELKEESRHALLAESELESGTYDKVEIEITQVTVVDDEGEHEAEMPSEDYTVESELVVEEDTTSSVSFDIIADESLHTTEDGEYVFAGVAQVETKSNVNADTSSESNVRVNGGQITSSMRVGMDINGNVGVNLGIAANAVLSSGVTGLSIVGESDSSLDILG